MECTENGVPLFNGKNYAICSGKMQIHIFAKEYDIWEMLKQVYNAKSSPPTDVKGKKLVKYAAKYKNAIVSGLTESVYVKVLGYKTNKELWVKLQNIYGGDSKVKEVKLQIFKAQFEQLKMKEYENIVAYFQ